VLLWASALPVPAQNGSKPVRFGLIRSLFRAADEGTVVSATHMFGELVAMQTGVRPEFSVLDEPGELARRIDSGELNFGVLHGIEYAWVRDRHPSVKPLVLACNGSEHLQAHLLVRSDSAYESLSDLRSRRLIFPRRSMNHVHLFLHRVVEATGAQPDDFFASIQTPLSVTDALEAVIEADADAVVVDGQALKFFREQQPVRSRRLRVLAESPQFPTAVLLGSTIPERKGLGERLQTGLLRAHERPAARELLLLWRLTRFEKPSNSYDQLLTEIVVSYPKPFEPVCFVQELSPSGAGGGR
jgi:ABC-type phosphate/phosphonate transport system substrate-binding protein